MEQSCVMSRGTLVDVHRLMFTFDTGMLHTTTFGFQVKILKSKVIQLGPELDSWVTSGKCHSQLDPK